MSGSILARTLHIHLGRIPRKALGVVVDGCPAGIPLSEEDIQKIWTGESPAGRPFLRHGRKATG